MKSFLSEARSFVGKNDFFSAVNVYRQAISTHPEIAWMYRNCLNNFFHKNKVAIPKVVFGMATIPDRRSVFEKSLTSICYQADKVNVYLDKYGDREVSLFLRWANIDFYRSSEDNSLRDNGKFFAIGAADDAYYFAVDDDILYPPNYVEVLINRIEKYKRKVVVGLHGICLPERADRYFSKDRKVFHFERELENDTVVDILGTGTIAFHSSVLRGTSIDDFEYPGMSDICFAILCKRKKIPLVAISRNKKWLKQMSVGGNSLYEEFKNNDDLQSKLLNENGPWGRNILCKNIAELIEFDSEMREPLSGLL